MRPVERKFHRTALQLHASDWAICRDLIQRACVHHEERQLLASGEGLEVPTGLGHAVHFVVDARKERDPWNIFLHVRASEETTSAETASAGKSTATISRVTSMLRRRRNRHSTARCTVAFSSNRTPPKIFSTYAGGAFQSAEMG